LLNVIFTTGSPFSAVGMGEMLPLRTAVAWPAAPQHELSVRLANL
jgi:fumarylacetoacetate (FAA) hydrolase family protein